MPTSRKPAAPPSSEETPAHGGATLAAGARLGPYEILGRIASGGMGEVYKARDTRLDRTVAVKLMHGGLAATPEGRLRFEREARAVSALNHPHICVLHDVGSQDGLDYLVMEYIEGTTLAARLADGPLPLAQAIEIGIQIADALAAAHRHGFVHRDLKPGNVMLAGGEAGRSGTVSAKLLDFGLAKSAVEMVKPVPRAEPRAETAAAATHAPVTGAGVIVGTVQYMAPEQLEGRPTDARTDLWALGTILFEMATGRRAFEADSTAGLIGRILGTQPPALATVQPLAPPALDRLVARCLAKHPDDRWDSAHDVADELRWIAQGSGAPLPAAGSQAARGPWAAAALWGAGFVVVALVAAGGRLAWRGWSRAALPAATPHQVTAASGWEAEARLAPAGSDIVYAAEDAGGNVDIWLVDAGGGSPIRLTDDPATDRRPAWYPDVSAIAFMSDRGGEPGVWKVPRLGGAPTMVVGNAQDPAISPDGRSIAFTRRTGGSYLRVFVAPLADAARSRVLTTDSDGLWNHETPAWSPDGRTICYAGHADLWTVPLAGGRPSRLTTEGEADFEPAYSADGAWVYFTSLRGATTAIWRVRAGGGTPERVTMGTGPERQPSFSSDGLSLAYSTYSLNANIVIRELATGKEYGIGGEREELSPAFAPDGSAVVYSSDQVKSPPDLWAQALSADASPMGPARRLTDHAGAASHPAYSPDGRWIAYYRVLGGQRNVWIVPAAGGAPIPFTGEPGAHIHPAWSPDGRHIAYAAERGTDAHIWLAAVADGRPAGPAEQVTSGPHADVAPAWSPDASMIAFVAMGNDGSNEAWVVEAGGTHAARAVTHGAEAHRVAWAATRDTLLVSGLWGGGRLSLNAVDLANGRRTPVGPPGLFGREGGVGEFATTADGRLLAVVRHAAKGDIWVMRATSGRY